MRFALEKNSATYQPWSQKRQKQTPRKRVGEEIASHMLHIPSKPPQFWSADFLQNYPLVTSNAGLNLIERPRDETLVYRVEWAFLFPGRSSHLLLFTNAASTVDFGG